MKTKILITIGFLLAFILGVTVGQVTLIKTQKPTEIVQKVIDRSLDKYTIENLSKISAPKVTLNIERELKDYPTFKSNLFSYNFDPTLQGSRELKKVSGLINVPKTEGKFPLIVMIRGYVPPSSYFVGNGTINSSIFFAQNGFITIAPDFLGYGESDKEPDNVFEARFQTYTTVMSLLNSLDSIEKWDRKNVFIWSHSNGGQIALTTLEVTGLTYPTVLWAPVTAPFPYSILYYSNEADDKGKVLRRELSKFEDVYDTDLYSIHKYLDRIKAPIQLNQGTADEAIPTFWSDELVEALKKQGLDVNYFKYSGADHQMSPLWNEVIQKDLEFFQKNLKINDSPEV